MIVGAMLDGFRDGWVVARITGVVVGESLGGSLSEIFKLTKIPDAIMLNTSIESKFGPTLLIICRNKMKNISR